MKRSLRSSPTYTRIRAGLGVVYVALGAIVILQMLHGVGLRFEAVPGLVFGAAMIGLGTLRLRSFRKVSDR